MRSVAVGMSGSLLAVGGHNTKTAFPAVKVISPLTNSWVRIMTGDLPEPREGCRTAIIQHNDSHWWGDNQSKLNKTDLIGTITVQNSSVGVTVTSTGLLQLCTETSICTHSFLHSQALFLHCITEQKVH